MEISELFLEEVGERSEYNRPHDFVSLAERHVSDEEPGVPREWLLAHVEILADESGLDGASFRAALETDTTDAETRVDDRSVYEVGEDRLSAYPPAWHDAFGGETSLPPIVRYLLDESDYRPTTGGKGEGVAKQDLFEIAAAVGGFSRKSAKAALADCLDGDTLAEDVDQHPKAKVYPPESEDVESPRE